MFRSIGTVLVIWYLSLLFAHSFRALDDALAASFRALENVATVTGERTSR